MDDAALWNSPVIASYLVWRMVRGYESVQTAGMPLLLLFPALTILQTSAYRVPLASRDFSSLSGYVTCFRDSSGKDSVSLGGLTEETDAGKDDALQALRFALAARLVSLDSEHGTLHAIYQGDNAKAQRLAAAYDKVEGHLADVLAMLLARESSERIAFLLGVRF